MSNLTKINENWVYQSNKLIESSYSLTMLEQKLIRVLASMVKKEDSDFKEYEFRASELMQIFNTKSRNFHKELDKVTDSIMKRLIKVKNIKTNEFEKYHFVDVAKYTDGVLKLKIHPELKPFYLNLEWYTKYQLDNILQFKSTYSFRIFELLKQYELIKERTIDIEDLRFKLDIQKNQYPKYSNLKQKVINVAVEEINSKTDIHVGFEEIKTSRKVTSIKFVIKSSDATATTELNQTEVNTLENLDDIDDILAIMDKHNISKADARKIHKAASGDIKKIMKCYKYTLTQNVDNVVAYMISLCKEFSEPITNKSNAGSKPKNKFMNFEQTPYDFEKIEKMEFERTLENAKKAGIIK